MKKILYVIILLVITICPAYAKMKPGQRADEGHIVSEKEKEFIVLWEQGTKKAVTIYKDKLKNGTNYEREVVLNLFERYLIVDLIPDVIDAIEDRTISPFHGDTGWGFVGHQAAWALANVSYKLDGIKIEDRGRDEYTFFSDMSDGPDVLAKNGRLKAVKKNWQNWWNKYKKHLTNQSSGLKPSLSASV